jgi:hypothetical protein
LAESPRIPVPALMCWPSVDDRPKATISVAIQTGFPTPNGRDSIYDWPVRVHLRAFAEPSTGTVSLSRWQREAKIGRSRDIIG